MFRPKPLLGPINLNGTLAVLPLPAGSVLLPSSTLAVQLYRKDSLSMLESVLAEADKAGRSDNPIVAAVPFKLPPTPSKLLQRRSQSSSSASSSGKNGTGDSSLRIFTPQSLSSSDSGNDADGVKPNVNQLSEYACAARIVRVEKVELSVNGRSNKGYVVVIEGICRLRIDRYTLTGTPYFEAQVTAFPRKSASEEPIDDDLVQRLASAAKAIVETLEIALSPRNKPNGGKRLADLPKIAPKISEFAFKSLRSSISRISKSTADELSDVLLSMLLPSTRPTSYPAKLNHLALLTAPKRVLHAASQLEQLNAGLEAREAVDDRFERMAKRKARELVLRGLLESIIQELRVLKKEEAEDNGLPTSPTPTGRPPIGLGQPSTPHRHDHDEGDDSDAEEEDELDSIRKKIVESSMPDETRRLCMKEFKRLQQIPPMSPEHGKARDYLDWMTGLPWGKSTFDLPDAQKIDKDFLVRARDQLESDHFGIHKVKERLLQYLAVVRLKYEKWEDEEAKLGAEEKAKQAAEAEIAKQKTEQEEQAKGVKLIEAAKSKDTDDDMVVILEADLTDADETPASPAKPKVPVKPKRQFRDKGPILCLVGPPGVGKTSIARSLATAMGRPFSRAALGGIRDEAEIRGFRRTYVGSMPGIFIQKMRQVGVNNPVILLDEIDKIATGSGSHGDPAAAMLEVLDPEQNHTFTDHYINTPVDLSSVLFIATANSLETIPGPLLDRMEVIHLSGYVDVEKLQIARKYLLPKQLLANSLQPEHVKIEDDALLTVINRYCGRESGVRNLERQVGSICRWKAVELARARDEESAQLKQPVEAIDVSGYNPSVQIGDLESILGHDFPEPETVDDEAHLKPGCAVGLGYTGSGTGCIMFVEVTSMPGQGGLRLTGSLGDVISESAQIALSWVKANAFDLGLAEKGENIMDKIDLHLHMPEGAMKKDGPSAGVAMTMSILSLFSGQPLDPRLAMTGEITLRGKVTAVGGIREKCLAAVRAGVKRLILPERNRKDAMADLPQTLRDEIEIAFVDNIWQAIEYAFPARSWHLPGPARSERKPVARLLNKL